MKLSWDDYDWMYGASPPDEVLSCKENKMAATKKTVTKKVSKKAAVEAALPPYLWAVSERKFFTWSPVAVLTTRESAEAYANYLQSQSASSFNSYKVNKVTVVPHYELAASNG